MSLEELIAKQPGGYKIQELIGRGGMGAVYRAYDPARKRQIALKVLPLRLVASTDHQKRFEREIKIHIKLGEHPHIVPFYDYGIDSNYIYVAMRYFPDGSLREYVKKHTLSLEHVSQWFNQIAVALDYAHSRGVIHRDVKLGNVLLELESNEAYLSDFGIAKIENATQLTRVGSIGTARYMAPERVLEDGFDGRVDVYSLGIMLFRLLTGRFPFTDVVDVAIIQQHLYSPIPRITEFQPGLPASLNQVIFRALAKDPDNRYRSCHELALAFMDALKTGRRQQKSDSYASMDITETTKVIDLESIETSLDSGTEKADSDQLETDTNDQETVTQPFGWLRRLFGGG